MKQTKRVALASRKALAFAAAATTLFAGLTLGTAVTPEAEASTATRDSYADTVGNPTFEAARQKYGLPKDMKDGATLHAFEWSFKTIMENIPDIAKAGYTSIQTEPIVKIKDNRKLGTGNWYLNWYYVYQPTDMAIGNYVVGSEDEFKEMCAMAHQYGLRIIVDSVSNHFTSDFDVIEGKWKNKSYFHEDKQISDYNNREDCTQHKLSGLWDLNTQDDTVAQGMADLLKQTVADGADGFRYDAAKHIELSDEVFGGKQSHYWDTILKNGAQYQYGEVLEDANVREADYANMFNASSVGGGGITDSSYGHEVRNAVQFKNLGASHFTSHSKVTEDKSVNWVESHDNFANGEANIPQELSDEWIKYGWAGVTAQKNGMSLFFDRPYHDGGTYGTTQGPFTEKSKLGDAGSDLWKDPEVVAVNHFRNAMVGESSNVSNCGDDNCLMVERYAGSAAQDGMVVANANGAEKNLAGQSTKLANGTYTDEVTGSTITVSGGTVTSGSVKAKSIAAFSNKTRSGKVSTAEAYPNKGTIPGTSKKITLRSYQATGTTYTTSDGQSGSYQDGDVIKIGASAKSGEVVTVTVKGTGADGETIKHTYSYTKHGDPTYDPNDGTQSPCDKYCVQYMEKNGYDPDKYIDADEPNYEGGEDITVTSVKISGDTSMDLSTTQSLQLKADVTTDPAGGRVTVNWSSSDESVATVDKTGKVTGRKAGTVKITAKAGDKSAVVTLTLTGTPPVAKNVIYAAKPSGWGKLYAYVYTGDGASAASNAKWPGVEMTAASGCDQTGYQYEVPDGLASNARVIFNDGGSQQYPGAQQPGISYNGGTVRWDGSSSSLASVTCTTNVPVTSVAITGAGVSSGKLSVRKGASAQLAATVSPGNATDRTVSWKSSDTAVATVDKAGKVTGVKAGKATITATAGGKSASVAVTVTEDPVKRPMTVYYKAPSSWTKVRAYWRVYTSPNTTGNALMEKACDGWWKVTVPDTKGAEAGLAFTDGKSWDNNGGKTYRATGAVMAVSGGKISTDAPSCQASAKPMTVWYKAPSSWTKVRAYWRVYTSPNTTGNALMEKACDGWWKVTVPDTKGAEAGLAFTDGKSWDNNGGKTYRATGSSMAVAGGQVIADITPVCAAEEPTPDVPVTSVTISGSGVSSGKLSVRKGASAQLTATVNPSNATSKTVTWKSSDTTVATVANGKVTGVKAGTATITATAGGKSASVTVTVTDTPSSLTIVGPTHSVAPETMQLTVSGLPADANPNQITWSVSGSYLTATNNPGRTFKVWGTRATTGVVTVKYQDQTASVPVTVDAYSYDSIPTIAVDQQSLTMKVGDSVKLNYTVTPSSSPFKLAIFDAWDEKVAFADGDGTIHAIGAGSTTVRVWSARGTNYTDVKVTVS